MIVDNPLRVPEGSYDFIITAIVVQEPNVRVQMPFTITLENPCPETPLVLADDQPFKGRYYSYYLRDDLQLWYDRLTVVGNGLNTDCGLLILDFYNKDTGEEINQELFDDGLGTEVELDELGREMRSFTVFKPTNINLNNEQFRFLVEIYYQEYPDNVVTTTFEVNYRVINECALELAQYGFEFSEKCKDE